MCAGPQGADTLHSSGPQPQMLAWDDICPQDMVNFRKGISQNQIQWHGCDLYKIIASVYVGQRTDTKKLEGE